MKKRFLCSFLAAVMLFGIIAVLPLRTLAYTNMTVSDEFTGVLKKMEGFTAYATWDYSHYTVGYGTTCPDDKIEYYKKNAITEEEAEELLHQQMTSFENSVNNFAKKYGLTLEQHQFDALVSVTYNCGAAWTKDINGYFNTAVREGDTGNALIYGILLHSTAGGDYILMKRRLTEANMYINGEYKAYNADSNPYPSNYKYVFLDGNGGIVNYAINGYDANDPVAVTTSFKSIPTGVDADGNPFVYEFAGWYTAETGGEKVELLDGSLAKGAIIYAHWKDPDGNVVNLSKGSSVANLEITVTSSSNVRTGPATFYTKTGTVSKGETVTITEVYTGGKYPWGKYEDGWIKLTGTDYEEVLAAWKAENEGTWPKTGTVKGTNVNVRTEPSTSGTVKYQLNTGDSVEISEITTGDSLTWGKLADGCWICMSYVTLSTEEEADPTVTGVTLLQGPTRLEYVQMQDSLDLTGTVLRVNYSDGSIAALTATRSMISTYSNADLGFTTVQLTYEGYSVSFAVNIVKATVTFLNYDGTVLSSAQYAYGDTVTVPEVPGKPADEAGEYTFAGWDKTVTACDGDATYTAVFELIVEEPEETEPEETQPEETQPEETEPEEEWPKTGVVTGDNVNVRTGPGTSYSKAGYKLNTGDQVVISQTVYDGTTYWWGQLADGNWICMDYVSLDAETEDPEKMTGDVNGDGVTNDEDVIHLLRYTLFPEKYSIIGKADYNADGEVNDDDVIYLLRHTLFPEKYPLTSE